MYDDQRARGRVAVMATLSVWSNSIGIVLGIVIAIAARNLAPLMFSLFGALGLWWWLPMYRVANPKRTGPPGPSVDDQMAEAERELKAGTITRAEFRRRLQQVWNEPTP